MIRIQKVPVVAAAFALTMGGCFYPAERGKALETKVNRLSDENAALRAELEKTRGELNAAVPKIDEKVAEVTKALESLDTASRRTDADTGVVLQKTIEDVASLRGQIDTYVHQLSDLKATLERVEAESEKKMLSMMGPEARKSFEARKQLEALQRPNDPRAFLTLAQTRAKEGDTTVARKLYDEWFRKYPKHALTGEAHFGLGELWFNEEKCREALFEYGKVIQEHPKTQSAPEAYLRSSDCFSRLKMMDEAKLTLQELVKNHPRSSAAKSAKTRLAELDKKPAKKGKR